jgi:DNA-binding transcriptional MerR regulator
VSDTTSTPLLSTGTVADRLGVTRKQIRAWVHRGLLVPRGRTRHGYYLWAEADVAAVARVREMADARAEYLARHARIAAGTARSA